MKYTFEDFKNTKIVVGCSNQSQWIQFLDLCDKKGVSFAIGNESVKRWETDWKRHGRVVACRGDLLTWCSSNDPLPKGVEKCVSANELLCPNPDYQIIITCWGDTTHADMFVNGHKVKETKAKRNPADKFNFRIGAQTAFNRLWEKKKKPVKPVNKYAQLFNEKMMEWAKDEVDKIFRRFDRLPTPDEV